MEQQLEQEKNCTNKQELQMAPFQKEFEQMRLQHQEYIAEKDSQIQKMHNEVDKLRNHPQTEEFIKESCIKHSAVKVTRNILPKKLDDQMIRIYAGMQHNKHITINIKMQWK